MLPDISDRWTTQENIHPQLNMLSLLLEPVPREILVFGDASYSCDLRTGAWAAQVSSLSDRRKAADPFLL